jgi:hypothetical protein
LELSQLLKLLAPLLLLQLILQVLALVDLIRREPERVRGSKLVWGIVILVVGLPGPLSYFIFARKE